MVQTFHTLVFLEGQRPIQTSSLCDHLLGQHEWGGNW